MNNFSAFFKEKVGEDLNINTLRKLDLVKEVQGVEYPTNAMILLSDDNLRNSLFHFAKVECARFKGVTSNEFIDQKSITTNIASQAEEAYNFVLRHINKGATVEGVYTIAKWEYPIKAVREVLRNSILHRDYSLTGKDVKVAIYDDMIEVTSPGLLPPSIDYSAMENRQSDARNKIIAPVLKKMGVIDQWGNGLQLIADELKEYPEIELCWREVGLSFQVQFVKRDFSQTEDVNDGLNGGLNGGLNSDLDDDGGLNERLLKLIQNNITITIKEISQSLNINLRKCERIIAELKKQGLLERQGSKKAGFWKVSYPKDSVPKG
ncbi:MAG: ATP-binding protein [Rikenellaceae bacterium]